MEIYTASPGGGPNVFRVFDNVGVVRADNSIIRFKTFCLHCTKPHDVNNRRRGRFDHARSFYQDPQGPLEPEEIWIKLQFKFGRSYVQLFSGLAGFSSKYQTSASCAQNSLDIFPAGDQSNLRRLFWPFASMQATAPNRERKENDFRSLTCGSSILLLHEISEHWRRALESLFHTAHSRLS